MKTNSFSIVVGTAACNAKCPYCVSKMTRSAASKMPVINERRFDTACRIVERAGDGLVSVLLTGNGEPLLFPEMISQYLVLMSPYNFPLIDLQTNGILVKQARDWMKKWISQGLTLVCISIAHHDVKTSNKLMGIEDDFNFYEAVDELHELGLAVRLNCTMLNSGIRSTHDIEKLIEQSKSYGVEQLTLREVEMPDIVADSRKAQAVRDDVSQEKPEHGAKRVKHLLEIKGATPITRLPHGAIVYDYGGQNVCVSNCLTRTTNPNDTRQIIYYPDGRITYDWQYLGARIL